jgi:hypothetical protein
MHSIRLSKYKNFKKLHPILGYGKEQDSREYQWQLSKSQMWSHWLASKSCWLKWMTVRCDPTSGEDWLWSKLTVWSLNLMSNHWVAKPCYPALSLLKESQWTMFGGCTLLPSCYVQDPFNCSSRLPGPKQKPTEQVGMCPSKFKGSPGWLAMGGQGEG